MESDWRDNVFKPKKWSPDKLIINPVTDIQKWAKLTQAMIKDTALLENDSLVSSYSWQLEDIELLKYTYAIVIVTAHEKKTRI